MSCRLRLATAISIGLPAVVFFGWVRPKWERHRDFLANADPYWMMEHMCKRDLLQACPRNIAKMGEDEE